MKDFDEKSLKFCYKGFVEAPKGSLFLKTFRLKSCCQVLFSGPSAVMFLLVLLLQYVPENLLPVYKNKVVPLADILTPNQFEAE